MPDTLQSVFDLPEVSFIDNDTVDAMMNRMVSNFEKKYKEVTGKSRSLAPADPMRILIYSVALDLYQLEMYTDRAGKQDLLKYSYGLRGALQGLIEQGCNGPCKDALDKLEKHLNKKAHETNDI